MRTYFTRDIPDYILLKGESARLARRIRTYWHQRGYYDVEVWVEEFPYGKDGDVGYSIRSRGIPTHG